MPSLGNPLYKAVVKTASGQEYDLYKSKVIQDLTMSDDPDSLAKEVSLTVMNAAKNGVTLATLIQPSDRLYIYANVGHGDFEVFRGVIWDRDMVTDTEKKVTFTAYDYLIYMMKSQDYFYYKKGLSTKEIVKRICTAWKLKLKYSYGSIKNKRIKPVQKNIGDMIVYVLNKAKSKLSSRYIFTIEGTTVIVKYANTNTTIYKIEEGKNVISIEVKVTMDDIVTKIKIYGEAKKKSIPKLASMSKNTSKFGTIQEIMDKDKKEKLSKIKKQAQKKLKSSAKVKYEYIVTAISNPKIKRGDTVYVGCGTAGLKGNKTVKSITHDCVAGTLLTMNCICLLITSPGLTSRIFVSPSRIHSSSKNLLSPPSSGSVAPPWREKIGNFPLLIASKIGTIVRSSLTTASVNDAVNLTLSGTPYVWTSPAG